MRYHTTHFDCGCQLERIKKLEELLSRGLQLYKFATSTNCTAPSTEWIREANKLLDKGKK